MILDELTLKNVGTFRGSHTIKLTPPASSKPIVLIGGLNGAGKTTILESINLALYGGLAAPTGRRAGGYDGYLRGLIHHGAPVDEGAAVELVFHAFQQGEKHQYRLRRWWYGGAAKVRETLMVSVDGKHDETLTSTWNEHVETFLPRGIAGLFFFDGEQIEALADFDRSQEVLKSALSSLLGLELVDRLDGDLQVLRRRHRGGEVPDELRQAVEERRQTVATVRHAEEIAVASVGTARQASERADKHLHELTEQYRSAGGGLLEQRESAETRLSLIRQQLIDLDEQLRQEAGNAAPLLQLGSLLEGMTLQATSERDAIRDQYVLSAVTERDAAILEQLRTAKVRTGTIKQISDFLDRDSAAREAAATAPRVSGLHDPATIMVLAGTTLPGLQDRLSELVAKRAQVRADFDSAERTLVAIPDPEALAPLKQTMDEASRDAMRCHAVLTQAEEHLGSIRADRAKADVAYEKALDKSAQATLEADDDRRLIEHLDRVRQTLTALKAAATERHLERISGLVLEALHRLMRKERFITSVRIAPETHVVELAGSGGRIVNAKELSAGERQLLAVALLWGLAQAAGQPLPMVIDTPLGRLDGSHRGHLIERYFPLASHQVILLSTDTEIDEDAHQVLVKQIGHAYHLEYDNKTHSSAVVDGYFWE